jgi:glyoxylase-like metal-dependent hydrolase (beta-lactamase superfamily II)
MYTITPVTGHIGGECYLFVTEQSALLLDAGFAFCADRTAANIRAALGDRPLDYILASHSHYDHLSGAAVIKRAYPMVQIVGSHHAKSVVEKPGARELMHTLNAGYARDAGLSMPERCLDGLAVDIALADGEEVRLPDMTIRAVATPGHTRCAMSYHLSDPGVLVCSETLGITPHYPDVVPCMIVGYQSTLDSIERSRRVGARRVFVSHHGLIPEGE